MVPPPRAALRADRLRALNAPRPVTVTRDAAGLPLAVAGAARDGADAPVPIDAVLDRWRLDDEWWRRPIARRYFEVLLAGGAHVVLVEDLVTGEWSAQQP